MRDHVAERLHPWRRHLRPEIARRTSSRCSVCGCVPKVEWQHCYPLTNEERSRFGFDYYATRTCESHYCRARGAERPPDEVLRSG